jgi:hypothetical protein
MDEAAPRFSLLEKKQGRVAGVRRGLPPGKSAGRRG